jgi:alpha/beta hydrolase fold
VRELAVGASAAVVFVGYDRSPEARFPMATDPHASYFGTELGERTRHWHRAHALTHLPDADRWVGLIHPARAATDIHPTSRMEER